MRYVIPLTPEPQRFSIVLAGRELLLAVRWMDAPEGGGLARQWPTPRASPSFPASPAGGGVRPA